MTIFSPDYLVILVLDSDPRIGYYWVMSKNRRPQAPKSVNRVQELRRSNAAQPVRNKARYSRQDRYARRVDTRRENW